MISKVVFIAQVKKKTKTQNLFGPESAPQALGGYLPATSRTREMSAWVGPEVSHHLAFYPGKRP